PVYGILVRWGTHKPLLTEFIVELTESDMDVIVFVLVRDKDGGKQQLSARSTLEDAGADMDRVRFVPYRSYSVWIGDYGPRFFWEDGILRILDHIYNRPLPRDNKFPGFLGDLWDHLVYNLGLKHGGGNFLCDSNGQGFISSLIRDDIEGNPNVTDNDIATAFLDYLNSDVTIYDRLPPGLERTGHIDMWMMPVSDDDVIVSEFLPGSDGYAETEAAVADLQSRGFNVWRTPAKTAGGIHYTYANSKVVNNKIFIPKYDEDDDDDEHKGHDEDAKNAYKAAKPNCKIVQLPCKSIINLGGAIHSIGSNIYVPSMPFVELLTPNGGQYLAPGQAQEIKWIAHGDPNVASVDLYYSADDGQTYPYEIASGIDHTRLYMWTVPDVSQDKCRVKIVVHDGTGSAEDTSDEGFVIDDITEVTLFASDFENDPNISDKWVDETPGWYLDVSEKHGGLASGKTDRNGSLATPDMDTSDAMAIQLDFWFRKDDTEPNDFNFFFHDGNKYKLMAKMDRLSYDDQWLHYTQTITDSQYFVSNFKIKFETRLKHSWWWGDENVWIDDVVITKIVKKIVPGSPTGLRGDIDKDDDVDLDDLWFVINNWTRDDCLAPTDCNGADIAPFDVGDNSVDYGDFALVSGNFFMGIETVVPEPSPSTWAVEPASLEAHCIIMTATTASDDSGVEYYFNNETIAIHDSGWQDSPVFEDTGLDAGTTYTYRVKVRDKSLMHNETEYSGSASAKTTTDLTAPDPNPMGWAQVPKGTGTDSVAMAAMVASDLSGTEYYFDCIDPNGHDSGWQESSYYEDSGLKVDTEFTYRVKARDRSNNLNETIYSSEESAFTDKKDITLSIPSRTWEDGRVWGNDDRGGYGNVYFDSYDNKSLLLGGKNGGQPYGYRTILSFDTTVIPENATILWAKLEMTRGYLVGANPFNWGGICHVDIASGFFGDSVFLENKDWESPADANTVARFPSAPPNGGTMTSTNINQEGVDNLNRFGMTQFKVHFTNLTNSGESWMGFYSGETVGKEPRLVVKYGQVNDNIAPTPNPAQWAIEPNAVGPYSIIMTAVTATDDNGVEYYFQNMEDPNNHDSGWQDSPTYQDVSLPPNTQYSYQVKARDKSLRSNETGYSAIRSATTKDGDPVFEQTFYSIPQHDGRVWGNYDQGIGRNYIDSNYGALILGGMNNLYGYGFIVSFDTSSLPDNCNIVAAKLTVVRGTKIGNDDPFDWGGECYIDIRKPRFGSSVTLVASDWNATPSAAKVANFFGPEPGPEGLLTSSNFNASGLVCINLYGTTQMRTRFTELNDGGYNWLGFYSGETFGKEPQLIIEYS
ncbi:MAG: agmatine deiminase family protein, partial [Planctomycetes bacterium]|nr:agmatine deiminase family protein [Planctomycetota bacterium]